MFSKIKKSIVLALFASMLGFGILMGLVFPLVVSPFVEWKSGMMIWFRLLSIVAGIAVGGVSILLVRYFLLRKIRLVSGQLRDLSEGQGHLTSRIGFSSDDDIGLLVAHFNLLLEKLQSSVERIIGVAGSLSEHTGQTQSMSQVLSQGREEKTQMVVDTAIAIDALEGNFAQVTESLGELQGSSHESLAAVQGQVAQIEKVNEQIVHLLSQCQANAESVQDASSASHRTVKNSQELSTALTEAAASMTEMDHTIREIDRSLKETSSISEKVAIDAGVGKEASWKTQKGMTTLSEAFEVSAGAIQTFSEKVKEIAAITEVIDEVTDQTNLLALNAAIIAAQAGEHGRGFAVVADQIKKLADQTSSSTREIGTLIKTFQHQAFTAIDSTAEIKGLIGDGVDLSRQAGESLDSILESAGGSHQQIQNLENAIKEIATTSHYLSEKVDSISGRANEISSANRAQEESLAAVRETVEDTRKVAGFLSESSREQLAASRKIREQTDTINGLIQKARDSIEQSEKETGELVAAIQKMQQLSRHEGETMDKLEKEGTRLEELYKALREEIERLAPSLT